MVLSACKKTVKRLAGLTVCVAAVLGLYACGGNDEAELPPKETLAFAEDNVFVERYAQTQLTLTGANPETAAYVSSDENILTVSEKGLVTGVNAGTAAVTATAGEMSASVGVTVKKNASYPVLKTASDSLRLPLGRSYALSPSLSYNGSLLQTTFVYERDKTGIAFTDDRITATEAGGYVCVVSCDYAGETFAKEVKVEAVSGDYFYLEKESVTLYTSDLYGEDLPTEYAASVFTNAAGVMRWTVSDESVACVDQTGKIVAIGAGTAAVTVKYGEYTESMSVTVKKPSLALRERKDFELYDLYADVDVTKIEGLKGEQEISVRTEEGTEIPVQSFDGGRLRVKSAGIPLGEQTLILETEKAVVRYPLTMASLIIDDKTEFSWIKTRFYKGGASADPHAAYHKYRDGYFILAADIDYGNEEFAVDPRDTDGSVFKDDHSSFQRMQVGWYGVLDGRGHIVRNIRAGRRGMFANIERESEIKNIAFADAALGPVRGTDYPNKGFLSVHLVGNVDNVLIVLEEIPCVTGAAGICYDLYGEISNTICVIASGQNSSASETVPYVMTREIKGNPSEPMKQGFLKNSFGLSRGDLRAVGAVGNGLASKYRVMPSFSALAAAADKYGFSEAWSISDDALSFGAYTLKDF